jgi:hypothetical protein
VYFFVPGERLHWAIRRFALFRKTHEKTTDQPIQTPHLFRQRPHLGVQQALARRVLDPNPPPQRAAMRAVVPLERRLDLELHAQHRAGDGAEPRPQLQVRESAQGRAHAGAGRRGQAQQGGDVARAGVVQPLERQAAVLQAGDQVGA